MLGVRRGDADAVAALAERYEAHLVNYVWRMTGDPNLAELIYRGALERVISALIEGQTIDDLKLRLFTEARGELRLQSMLQTQEPPSFEGDPEDLTGEELAVRAKRSLNSLPRGRREALLLKLYHRLSYEQLAALLEMTPAQARYEVDLALARVAEMVL